MTARPVVFVGVALTLAGLALGAWAWRTLASARRRGVLTVRGPYGCVWRACAYGRPAFLPRPSRGLEALAGLGRRPNRRMDEKGFAAGAGTAAKGRASS